MMNKKPIKIGPRHITFSMATVLRALGIVDGMKVDAVYCVGYADTVESSSKLIELDNPRFTVKDQPHLALAPTLHVLRDYLEINMGMLVWTSPSNNHGFWRYTVKSPDGSTFTNVKATYGTSNDALQAGLIIALGDLVIKNSTNDD